MAEQTTSSGPNIPIQINQKSETDYLKEITETKPKPVDYLIEPSWDAHPKLIEKYAGLLGSIMAKGSLDKGEYRAAQIGVNMIFDSIMEEMKTEKNFTEEDFRQNIAAYLEVKQKISLAREGPNNIFKVIKLSIVESYARTQEYMSQKQRDAKNIMNLPLRG